MEHQALRETLCFALDITDYRDYLGANPDFISNQQVLRITHEIRSRSKLMPEEICRASKVWRNMRRWNNRRVQFGNSPQRREFVVQYKDYLQMKTTEY
jgi:hypothetical protein